MKVSVLISAVKKIKKKIMISISTVTCLYPRRPLSRAFKRDLKLILGFIRIALLIGY